MPSVERVRFARFRVIATTVVSLLILATLVFLLTGGNFFQHRAVLYVYLPDGTGLGQGSPVRVDGIQVGKVDGVVLSSSNDPNRVVRVTMIVDRAQLASITVDSSAQPAADTLVGDKYIQISSGKRPERVQPGAEIAYKGAPDLMTSLDLSQFSKSLGQMDAFLTDIEGGKSELGQFVMTDSMYRDLLHRVAELETGVRAASSTTSSIGHELYTDVLYRQISEPIARVDEALARLQSGQGSGGRFLRDNAQYEELHAKVAELRKSIAEIHKGEFFTSGKNYDGWVKTVGGLIRQVDEFSVSPALLRTDVYENLNGMAKELQGSLKEFRQDPRKFLRLKVF